MKKITPSTITPDKEAILNAQPSLGKTAYHSMQKLLFPGRTVTLFLIFLFSASFAEAATKYWVGGTGTGKDWTLATNWREGDSLTGAFGAPVTGNDIVINSGNKNYLVFSTMPSSVSYNSLSINGYITFANGEATTLTIGGNAGTDFSIANGRVLTLSNNVTITLAIGSTATISANAVFEVLGNCSFNTGAAGAATTVNGMIQNNGTGAVTSATTSNMSFTSGSTYRHWRVGGAIPMATWAATATCNISYNGFKLYGPDPVSFGQVFGNLIWDCVQDEAPMILAPYLKTVQGDLDIRETGSSEYETNKLTIANSETGTLNIGGSLKIGGYVAIEGGNVNAGSTTIYRLKDKKRAVLTINNGTVNIASLTVGPHEVKPSDGNIYFNPLTRFNLNGGILNISGDMSLYPDCNFTCTNTPALNITGSLTNNGKYNKSFETVTFNGTAAQFIQGSPPTQTNFYNLIISNTSGVTMQTDVKVSNQLTFANGILATGAKTLTLDKLAPAISGAGPGKYVNGNLRIDILAATASKTFQIGDATNYTPVILDFSGTTNGTGNIVAKTTPGDHPNTASSGSLDINKSVNRYWTLTNNGVTFGSYSATFNFINPGDLDGGTNPNILVVQRFVPSTWYSTTLGTRTSNSIQITGASQTQFGAFEVAQVICTTPANYSVTGGGSYCAGSPTSFPVGLSGSETNVNYQLKLNGVDTDTPVAGTGSGLPFGNFSAAGTYTVVATRVSGGCSIAMSDSASVKIISAPTLTAGNNGPVCSGTVLLLTASSIPDATYTWAGPNGYTSSKQNDTVSKFASILMSGTYNVHAVVNVTNGTCSLNSSTGVIVNPSPVQTAAKEASEISFTSFNANWFFTSNASGYRLDVSPDFSFSTYLAGYNDLDVLSSVNTKLVNGLTPGINAFYYRVRAYNANCTGLNSGVVTVPLPAKYKSWTSGNWNNIAIWRVSYDGGSNWDLASFSPSSSDLEISIQPGNVVTITSDVDIDQVTVEAGGTLVNNFGAIFSINDGSGTDLLVNGTLISKGDIDNSGTISFASGGLYQHIRSISFPGKKMPMITSEIPQANWDINSTCEILSVIGTIYDGLNQEFGNFTWNFVDQIGDIELAGDLTTINGNFTVANTGGGNNQLRLSSSQSNALNIGGKLSITGGKLALPPSGKISVGGTTSLGATGDCLILKSDASGTASFIDNGTPITGTGTASIERYLGQYDDKYDHKFHFLSSPVGAGSIMPNFQTMANTTDDFYMWSETSNEWINTKLGTGPPYTWNTSFGSGNGAFVPGKGYLVAYPADETKTFTGKPYTDAIGLTVTCTKSSGGWNLLGNPFPSAIDWDYMVNNSLLGNGMDNALYYYDNSLANYRYYIPLTGGTGGATRYIPAMQGFMVHANTNSNKTVILKNAARTHTGQTNFYKSAAALTSNILNLNLEGNSYSDQARVCFYELATTNFDNEFDAYKLFSYNAGVPQLYSITPDNTQLAINTLPQDNMYGEVPLGFKAGVEGTYSITADGIMSFPPTMYIKLEDKKTGTIQKLNDNPVYNFTANANDDANRFILHFQNATSVDKPEMQNSFSVLIDNGLINVTALTNVSGQVNIIDMSGRKVGMSKLVSGSPAQINLQGHPGVYIVNIVTREGVVNQKVVVK